MKTENQELGVQGEVLASEFYKKNGYTILETNWRCYHLEVDLIVANDDVIVFSEVKTRSSTVFGDPETFVTPEKQRNLIKAANIYITRKEISKEVRFDIVSVIICGDKHQLHHIPDAFLPRW